MSVSDTQSGVNKIIWYYKLSDVTSYTSATDTYTATTANTTRTHTFTGLEQNKTYKAYAVVYDAVGRKKQSGTIDVATVSVATASGATYTPSEWTNGDVTVTLPTKSGYSTLYTTDGTLPTNTSTKYTSEITLKSNCVINYVYSDGTNIGGAGTVNITNIDKLKPTIATLSGSSNKGNSGTVTIIGMSDNTGSGVSGYYISKSNETPTKTSVSWIPVTSSTYGHKVTENGTYYVWIIDKVGNISDPRSCTVSGIVAKVTYVKLNDITMLAGKTQSIPISNDGEYSKMESSSSTEGILQFYGPSTINAKSVGTTTLTVTLTNYDGTTVSGSCTVTVKKPNIGYEASNTKYVYITDVEYTGTTMKFNLYTRASTVSANIYGKLIGKISLPPVQETDITITGPVSIKIDTSGNVYLWNVSSNEQNITLYRFKGLACSYTAIVK